MSQSLSVADAASQESNKVWAVRFLLLVAGLGGLLYGVDVGIIAGALPYLEATSGLTARPAFVHRRRRVAGQRDLDPLCRHAGRFDGPQDCS